jgi:hypothetical protein
VGATAADGSITQPLQSLAVCAELLGVRLATGVVQLQKGMPWGTALHGGVAYVCIERLRLVYDHRTVSDGKVVRSMARTHQPPLASTCTVPCGSFLDVTQLGLQPIKPNNDSHGSPRVHLLPEAWTRGCRNAQASTRHAPECQQLSSAYTCITYSTHHNMSSTSHTFKDR